MHTFLIIVYFCETSRQNVAFKDKCVKILKYFFHGKIVLTTDQIKKERALMTGLTHIQCITEAKNADGEVPG